MLTGLGSVTIDAVGLDEAVECSKVEVDASHFRLPTYFKLLLRASDFELPNFRLHTSDFKLSASCRAPSATTPVGSPSTPTACAASCAASAGRASTRGACSTRRRIPARYRRCDFENFQVYPNEKLTNAVSGRAPVCRRVSRQRQGALPHRSARHRQDASGRRGAQGRARPRVRGNLLRGLRPAAADSQHLQPGHEDGRDGHSPAARVRRSCSCSTTSARRRRPSGSKRR